MADTYVSTINGHLVKDKEARDKIGLVEKSVEGIDRHLDLAVGVIEEFGQNLAAKADKTDVDKLQETVEQNKIVIDKTLKNEGEAADAKAVGDALASIGSAGTIYIEERTTKQQLYDALLEYGASKTKIVYVDHSEDCYPLSVAGTTQICFFKGSRNEVISFKVADYANATDQIGSGIRTKLGSGEGSNPVRVVYTEEEMDSIIQNATEDDLDSSFTYMGQTTTKYKGGATYRVGLHTKE